MHAVLQQLSIPNVHYESRTQQTNNICGCVHQQFFQCVSRGHLFGKTSVSCIKWTTGEPPTEVPRAEIKETKEDENLPLTLRWTVPFPVVERLHYHNGTSRMERNKKYWPIGFGWFWRRSKMRTLPEITFSWYSILSLRSCEVQLHKNIESPSARMRRRTGKKTHVPQWAPLETFDERKAAYLRQKNIPTSKLKNTTAKLRGKEKQYAVRTNKLTMVDAATDGTKLKHIEQSVPDLCLHNNEQRRLGTSPGSCKATLESTHFPRESIPCLDSLCNWTRTDDQLEQILYRNRRKETCHAPKRRYRGCITIIGGQKNPAHQVGNAM